MCPQQLHATFVPARFYSAVWTKLENCVSGADFKDVCLKTTTSIVQLTFMSEGVPSIVPVHHTAHR